MLPHKITVLADTAYFRDKDPGIVKKSFGNPLSFSAKALLHVGYRWMDA